MISERVLDLIVSGVSGRDEVQMKNFFWYSKGNKKLESVGIQERTEKIWYSFEQKVKKRRESRRSKTKYREKTKGEHWSNRDRVGKACRR